MSVYLLFIVKIYLHSEHLDTITMFHDAMSQVTFWKTSVVGGFNPIEKIIIQFDHLPKSRKNNNV